MKGLRKMKEGVLIAIANNYDNIYRERRIRAQREDKKINKRVSRSKNY
jgi:hypothetical protein